MRRALLSPGLALDQFTQMASAETLKRGEGSISLDGAWLAKWGRSRVPSGGRAATPQPVRNPMANVACKSTAAARWRPSFCLIANPPCSRVHSRSLLSARSCRRPFHHVLSLVNVIPPAYWTLGPSGSHSQPLVLVGPKPTWHPSYGLLAWLPNRREEDPP